MGKIIKNKKILLVILVLLMFASGTNAQCNSNAPLEIAWPPSPLGTQLEKCSSLTIMVKYLYEWGITLGGLAAFVALVIAGFIYLTSIGNPARMNEAKERAIWAIGGLTLLLGSWLLLNTINPQFTTFQTSPLNLSGILPYCSDDSDCPSPDYECYIEPGQTQGVCIPKIEMNQKPCDYAIVYSEVNMQGTPTILTPDEAAPVVLSEVHSVQAFYANGSSAGPTAGGCTLQLFAGRAWGLRGCGDRMATIVAYETDLYRWVDRPIKCVKLVRPPSTSTPQPQEDEK